MEEDLKEQLTMLADSTSPFWAKSVSGTTMEQIYQTQRDLLARQGVMLSRLGYLQLAGLAQVTPRGLLKLAELGVEVVGYSVTIAAPTTRQRNGR